MQRRENKKSPSPVIITRKIVIAGLILFALGACSEQVTETAIVADSDMVQPKGALKQPNLLIVMADDLGYSDLGAFGGEIETPNIDALANSGVQMINFYTSLTCSPSRAMLMAGADNHLVGLGNMDETLADNQLGLPGYEGHLNERVLTLAEALKSGGYNTYMAGKWHLGLEKEQGPAARGFDESFALLFGGASHYENSFGPDGHRTTALYRDNGKLLKSAPAGFFSSNYYTDRIIQNIENGSDGEKPFFAYLSFTAPHWPLQFPPDYSGKYSQTYKEGWHEIRERRMAKLKQLELVPEASNMAPLAADWDALTDEEKLLSAKKMEIYAAMVDDMDANVGRLISYLKSKGVYDNTVVVFLSDNGADSWGNDAAPPAVSNWANKFNNKYENAGQPDSFILYGRHWGNVSNTPFKHSKGNTSEGGIHAPMIVRMPAQAENESVPIRSQALSGIEDIMPTFLELAGIDVQTLNTKENQVPITGNSLLSVIADGHHSSAEKPQGKKVVGREMWAKQGIRVGNWKLINQPPPNGNGDWQLYNLNSDLAEQIDLASAEPQKLTEMLGFWQEYVDHNNVVLPEGGFRVREAGQMPTE